MKGVAAALETIHAFLEARRLFTALFQLVGFDLPVQRPLPDPHHPARGARLLGIRAGSGAVTTLVNWRDNNAVTWRKLH